MRVLPPDLAVGRYCSIAIGFEVFLDRHRVGWATTSAVTYDADPLVGYPALAAAHRDFNPCDFVLAESPGLLAPAPRIGHDVWIGQYAQAARDVTIGNGAVIGAGAVVTRDVPPCAIVTGVPARILRMRFEPDVVEALLASRWWEFDASVVRRCDFRDPGRFAAQVMSLPNSERWWPESVTAESLLRALRH